MDGIRHLLRRHDASAYLLEKHGVSYKPATLSKLVSTGGGPRFRKFGSLPLYSPADLDAWVASKLSPVVASSDELPGADPSP